MEGGGLCMQGCIKVVRKSSVIVFCDFPTILKSYKVSLKNYLVSYTVDHRILLDRLIIRQDVTEQSLNDSGPTC